MPAIPQRTDWKVTPGEYGFFTTHPGGFDRQFFMQNLIEVWARYLNENALRPEDTQLVIVLENGDEIGTLNARPALTWVELTTDEGDCRIVPMAAVRQVKIRPRPGPPAAVGFSVTAGPEEISPDAAGQPAALES
jgi:hypothetical protein